MERVWIIHVLRTLEKKGWLSSLQRLAIVLDGPLAVFGAPAWLSAAIQKELVRINDVARRVIEDDTFDLLLIGVEKTGIFVKHLEDLDKGPTGERNALPHQSAMLLTDGYIKEHIIFSTSEQPYGRNTYFGRKILYKTASGSLIVATLPILHQEQHNLKRADAAHFPRLVDTLSLLDKLVSARYRNALSPLISAHAEAAIPMNLGVRVLEKLARQLMAEAKKGHS